MRQNVNCIRLFTVYKLFHIFLDKKEIPHNKTDTIKINRKGFKVLVKSRHI